MTVTQRDHIDLAHLRVAVSGGGGFLGRAVCHQLDAAGCHAIAAPRSADYDLRTEDGVKRFYADFQPDIVIHLAATSGGVGASSAEPGRFFYDNAIMGLQLMEHGRRVGLTKFVGIGTVCSYPDRAPLPCREDTLWDGYPEPGNAAYGIAKRMLVAQAQAYRTQYGFNAITLLPTNLYGPGDDFSWERSHAVAAIMRRCHDARTHGARAVTLWGDGSPTRELLYVDDAARGIVSATRSYDDAQPVNLTSGVEVSIDTLARRICAAVGYDGDIQWDTSRPNGQQRRAIDGRRATAKFGFAAQVTLDQGLTRMYDWYLAARGESALRP